MIERARNKDQVAKGDVIGKRLRVAVTFSPRQHAVIRDFAIEKRLSFGGAVRALIRRGERSGEKP